jgi:hypothetical protein
LRIVASHKISASTFLFRIANAHFDHFERHSVILSRRSVTVRRRCEAASYNKPSRVIMWRLFASASLPLFELALVLVRLDHVAGLIVNANDGIMRSGSDRGRNRKRNRFVRGTMVGPKFFAVECERP